MSGPSFLQLHTPLRHPVYYLQEADLVIRVRPPIVKLLVALRSLKLLIAYRLEHSLPSSELLPSPGLCIL